MDNINCRDMETAKKHFEQFTEFVDLTDEDLDEIGFPQFDGIHGVQGGHNEGGGWGGSCCGDSSGCCHHHHHHHHHHHCC